MKTVLTGEPFALGRHYGALFKSKIADNIRILVHRTGFGPPPAMDAEMASWINGQEQLIRQHWPWIIDEMRGTAAGAGATYEEILHLNLRIWLYEHNIRPSGHVDSACSSLAIGLSDGTIANIGALDDPAHYYCGVVHVIPAQGISYLSFPIAGTSWGNRGVNAAGLALSQSSQSIPGLQRNPGTICADIALRAILQTCTTVAQVREFCQRHPFSCNLVCSDATGAVWCAHQTTAGIFELSRSAPYALTNHIADDRILCKLSALGAGPVAESPSTRLRRGRLMEFAATNHAQTTGADIRTFIARCDPTNLSMTCPQDNVVLTYCNPQAELGMMWTADPQGSGSDVWQCHSAHTPT